MNENSTPETVCVVTGASSGIGRATAIALARRGVSLVLGGRNEARLVETGRDCRGHGVQALEVPGDVADPAHSQELFEKALSLRNGGRLCAVFAAGTAAFGPTLDQATEVWDASISANLTGMYHCCRAAIRAMSQVGGGRIVNILSIASRHAFPQSAAYVASKFGAYGLTQSLAAEFRDKNIAFTAFLPGSTDTPLWEPMDWTPEKSSMLAATEVGAAVADIVCSPHAGVYDEVLFMPPKGVL